MDHVYAIFVEKYSSPLID